MSDYIKREDAIKEANAWSMFGNDNLESRLKRLPSADVVEVGLITCFGIKFVIEGDIIKVKWRYGNKHYIVPLAGLLELWERYEEQEHGASNKSNL